MSDPAAVTLAQDFQSQLRGGSPEAILAIGRRWGAVEAALQSTIDELSAEIDALLQAGETVPTWKLLQMERYQSLMAQIGGEVSKFMQWAMIQMMDDAKKAQLTAYDHAQEMMNAAAEGTAIKWIDLRLDKLGVEATEKITALAQAGNPLFELLNKAYPQAVQSITDKLVSGAALGWNPRKTAREALRLGLGDALNHVLLVARDQQIRNYREGQRDFYKSSGLVYGYKRLAAKQERTCMACLALDGQVYPTGQVMELHPQDRCTMIPLVKGAKVPEWETGRQWFEKQPPEVQKKMLGPGAYELWRGRKIAFDDLVTVKPNVTWGPSAQVTPLKKLRQIADGRAEGNRIPFVDPRPLAAAHTVPTKAKSIEVKKPDDPILPELIAAANGSNLPAGVLAGAKRVVQNAKQGDTALFETGPDGSLVGAISYKEGAWVTVTGAGFVDGAANLKGLQAVAQATLDKNKTIETTVPQALIPRYTGWGFEVSEWSPDGLRATMTLAAANVPDFIADPVSLGNHVKQKTAEEAAAALADPDQVVKFVTGVELPSSGFTTTTLENADIPKLTKVLPGGEPTLKVPKGKHAAAGMILIDPKTGKVVLAHPSGNFGGYQATIPKGTVEKGESFQSAAIREVFEETGFKARVVGMLGDYEKTTSVTRFYIGVIEDGAPWAAHYETAAVSLAPLEAARNVVNVPGDKSILDDAQALIQKALATGQLESGLDSIATIQAETKAYNKAVYQQFIGGTGKSMDREELLAALAHAELVGATIAAANIKQDLDSLKEAAAAQPLARLEARQNAAAWEAYAQQGPDALTPDAAQNLTRWAYASGRPAGDIADLEALSQPRPPALAQPVTVDRETLAKRQETPQAAAAVREAPAATITIPDELQAGSKAGIIAFLVGETGALKWKLGTMPKAALVALSGKPAGEIVAAANKAGEDHSKKYEHGPKKAETPDQILPEPEPPDPPTVDLPPALRKATKKSLVDYLSQETGALPWKLNVLPKQTLETLFGKTKDDILAAAEEAAILHATKYPKTKLQEQIEEPPPPPVDVVHLSGELQGAGKTALVDYLVTVTGALPWKLKTLPKEGVLALFGKSKEEILAAADEAGTTHHEKYAAGKKAKPKKGEEETAAAVVQARPGPLKAGDVAGWSEEKIARVISLKTGVPVAGLVFLQLTQAQNMLILTSSDPKKMLIAIAKEQSAAAPQKPQEPPQAVARPRPPREASTPAKAFAKVAKLGFTPTVDQIRANLSQAEIKLALDYTVVTNPAMKQALQGALDKPAAAQDNPATLYEDMAYNFYYEAGKPIWELDGYNADQLSKALQHAKTLPQTEGVKNLTGQIEKALEKLQPPAQAAAIDGAAAYVKAVNSWANDAILTGVLSYDEMQAAKRYSLSKGKGGAVTDYIQVHIDQSKPGKPGIIEVDNAPALKTQTPPAVLNKMTKATLASFCYTMAKERIPLADFEAMTKPQLLALYKPGSKPTLDALLNKQKLTPPGYKPAPPPPPPPSIDYPKTPLGESMLFVVKAQQWDNLDAPAEDLALLHTASELKSLIATAQVLGSPDLQLLKFALGKSLGNIPTNQGMEKVTQESLDDFFALYTPSPFGVPPSWYYAHQKGKKPAASLEPFLTQAGLELTNKVQLAILVMASEGKNATDALDSIVKELTKTFPIATLEDLLNGGKVQDAAAKQVLLEVIKAAGGNVGTAEKLRQASERIERAAADDLPDWLKVLTQTGDAAVRRRVLEPETGGWKTPTIPQDKLAGLDKIHAMAFSQAAQKGGVKFEQLPLATLKAIAKYDMENNIKGAILPTEVIDYVAKLTGVSKGVAANWYFDKADQDTAQKIILEDYANLVLTAPEVDGSIEKGITQALVTMAPSDLLAIYNTKELTPGDKVLIEGVLGDMGVFDVPKPEPPAPGQPAPAPEAGITNAAAIPLPPGYSYASLKKATKGELVAHLAQHTTAAASALNKKRKADLIAMFDPIAQTQDGFDLDKAITSPIPPVGTIDIVGADQNLLNDIQKTPKVTDSPLFQKGFDKALGSMQANGKTLLYKTPDGKIEGIITLVPVGGELKVQGLAAANPALNKQMIADALATAASEGKNLQLWVPAAFQGQYKDWGFTSKDGNYFTATAGAVAPDLLNAKSDKVSKQTSLGPLPPPPGVATYKDAVKLGSKKLASHIAKETGLKAADLELLDVVELAKLLGTEGAAAKAGKMITEAKEIATLRGAFAKFEEGGVSRLISSKDAAAALQYIQKSKRTFPPAIVEQIKQRLEELKEEERQNTNFIGVVEKEPIPSDLPQAAALPNHDDFPKATGNLKRVQRLGGSSGENYLVEDEVTGKRFVLKPGASRDHLLEEASADAAYQAMGLAVPRFQIYEEGGRVYKLSEAIENPLSLDEALKKFTGEERKNILKQVRAGFAADALMGNWDVLGLAMDNVLVDPSGKVWRVDNGGSLRFRALGKQKTADDWNDFLTDLWTMREPGRGGAAENNARIFGDLGWYEITRQAEKLLPQRREILAALPPQARQVMNDRLNTLKELVETSQVFQKDRFTEEYSNEFFKQTAYLRKEGLIDKTRVNMTQQRKGDVHIYDEEGKLFDDWRGDDSTMSDMAAYMKKNGGDMDLIARWGSSQGNSSWSEYSRAIKYARGLQRGGFEDYYFAGGVEQNRQIYEKIRNQWGAEKFDKSLAMFHALTFEALKAGRYPRVYSDRGYVELVRTENNDVPKMYDFPVNPNEARPYIRGAAESGSIYSFVTVYGDNVFAQRVPLHRIWGFYLQGRDRNYGSGMFLTDTENEFVFDGAGVPSVHVGKTHKFSTPDQVWDMLEKNGVFP